ncbi:MAG: hypothetical protein GY841_23070 [FCB group bacterium]|nr:hypothetical protein [FCB group bacterium]
MSRRRFIYNPFILVLLVLALGLGLRVANHSLDPPIYIGTSSQDLATDPYHVISFAANKDTFGTWEPFSFPKWQAFKISLTSLTAHLLFQLAEPNCFWISMAGVIPSFLGIIMLVWATALSTDGKYRWRPALTAALFLSPNFILILYNRTPFLEAGLFFCLGLIVLLYRKFGLRTANILIISVLTALACVTGKIFGVTFFLAVLAAILFGPSEKRLKKSGWLVLSWLISMTVLLLLLYGDRLNAYLYFIGEHSYHTERQLYILQSPLNFVKALLSFGSDNRVFEQSPFLFIAGYLAVIFAIIGFRVSYDWFKDNDLLRFALYLLAALFLLLFPFNYRPIRYAMLLYLPLILVAAQMTLTGDMPRKKCPASLAPLSIGLLFFLNYLFMIHLVIDFMLHSPYPENPWPIYGGVILPALLFTAVMTTSRINRLFFKSIPRLGSVILLLAVCSLIYQGREYFNWATLSRPSLEMASHDLSEILGKNAVVAGPYAPRLTVGSDHKCFIYYFGLKKSDTNIFKTFPITHLAVDKVNYNAAVLDFDEIADALPVTTYLIHGRTVEIVRLKSLPGNYQPGAYELADDMLRKGEVSLAYNYNKNFLRKHPQNISGNKQLFAIYVALGDINRMDATLNGLARKHPDNLDVQFFCAIKYKIMGVVLSRSDLLRASEQALAKAKKMNHPFGDLIQEKYNLIQTRSYK